MIQLLIEVYNKLKYLKKNTLPAIILRLSLFLIYAANFSYANDPVTIVQYPLLNRPVLVQPGQSFTIEYEGSGTLTKAVLSLPELELYNDIELSISNNAYGKVTAAVPFNTPYELYDLIVTVSGGSTDQVTNCVRVLSSFKDTFTFIHLPDCHLPAVAWEMDYIDPNTITELRQIIKEINYMNPEFILQTGDIVNNGQNWREFILAQSILSESEVPIFINGGNHDLWYTPSNWHHYFGSTMNYSFMYGQIRFLGLEMYNEPWPRVTYTADQMNWLTDELETSVTAGDVGRIIFTHFDESNQLTGDFVDKYLVDGILYGHLHVNLEQSWGTRQAPKLCTSYTMNNNGDYRLVKVQNGSIVDYPVLNFRNFWVNISPKNDSSS